MREQWKPVDGGPPTLHLWSEDQDDAALTSVECALLRATLRVQIESDPSVAIHLAALSIESRWFTGWGFYLNFAASPNAPTSPLLASSGIGSATITMADKSPLGTVCFAADGRLEYLEAFTIPSHDDESSWPVEACVELLRHPLSSVSILST